MGKDAMKDICRRFGQEAIWIMDERPCTSIEVIPTGSLALDLALGVGGVPRGRITEIYGPEASGKTTLALHIAAEAQKVGDQVAFIDVEQCLDLAYARRLGTEQSRFYVSQPVTGEQALEIAEALIRSQEFAVVIIDSVAALVPRAEVEGEMGDYHAGLQSRIMSQAMRKLVAPLRETNTALVFTNQLRFRLGVMFGNSETTCGGVALKYHATMRLDLRRLQAIKQDGQVVGSRVRVRVKKNKVAPPFREAEFDLLHGTGIAREADLLDTGLQLGVITQESSCSFDGRALGPRRKALTLLRKDLELARELERAIRARINEEMCR